MRSVPTEEDEREELERLNVEPWTVEYLKLNPEYVHWGPGEDYMSTIGDSWGTSQEIASWTEFGPWTLDELNEVVHFYFEVDRKCTRCVECDRSGYNPATKELADTFYDLGDFGIDFSTMTMHGDRNAAGRERGATGRKWCDRITQDEVDALVAEGCLRRFDKDHGWVSVPRTAAEVNAANSAGTSGMSVDTGLSKHDAIDRYILIETRAKRLGVWGMCETCRGNGFVFTELAGHLNLVIWFIHPRKSCSRGVRILNLSQQDASAAKDYLAEAARRNARRFSGVL